MTKPAMIERHRRPVGGSAPVWWLVVPILVMPLLAVPGWRVLWNQCGQMLPVLRGADRSASYRQARAALALEAAILRIRQAARTLAGVEWAELNARKPTDRIRRGSGRPADC